MNCEICRRPIDRMGDNCEFFLISDPFQGSKIGYTSALDDDRRRLQSEAGQEYIQINLFFRSVCTIFTASYRDETASVSREMAFHPL